MEAAAADPNARQMTGFKSFFQYRLPTRVIAGRDLLGSTGFEIQKEGAHRVFLVTDKVIRDTGLIDRVEAGVTDGGLEGAGVFDDVPQDFLDPRGGQLRRGRQGGGRRFLPRRGRRLGDGHRQGADAIFTHGGSAREQEGFPDAARGRRQAARHRAARLHTHHGRHRLRGVDGGGDQGAR